MTEPQPAFFTQLRGIIGGYLVDLILEKGSPGIARLVREGLDSKAQLEEDDDEKVRRVLARLE
jgi:hypothetical protein